MGPLLRSTKFQLFFGFVLLFILALGLLWPGSGDVSLLRGDERQYARIAFNLLRYGEFHDAHDLPGHRASGTSNAYMRHEPGYPLYLTAVFLTVPKFDTMSIDDIFDERNDDHDTALPLRRRVGQAGAVMAAAFVSMTFVAAYTILRNWPLSIAASLLTMMLLPRDSSGNLLTALFLLVHISLAVETWRRPRILIGALSGLALGLLALTEAVFQYWLIGFAIIGLAGLWRDAERRRLLAPPLAVALLAALALSVPWMTRNQLEVGHFGVAGRLGEVLAVRASFDQMTWPEVRGAFAYYLPVKGALRSKAMRWLEPETFARFNWSAPEGFYLPPRTYGGDITARADVLAPGWRQPSDTYVGRWTVKNRMAQDLALRRAALEIIRENWLKHLVLTAAFAERGSRFICRDYGSARSIYGVVVDKLASLGCVSASRLSLLFIPALGLLLFLAWKRRDFALAFLSLPVVWMFGILAVTTEFLPRYSEPLVPVLALMLMLAVREVWQWSKRWIFRF